MNTLTVNESDFIKEAANLILNTRDFCGDEVTALNDFANEHNIILDNQMREDILFTANLAWRDSQKAAGVKKKYWKY